MQGGQLVVMLAGGLALITTTGCPQPPGGGNGEVVEYAADLDGVQEIPPVVTDGTGSATLERDGNVLSFDITASGLTGPLVMAHFHNGAVGVDGPVIFNLTDLVEEENGEVSIVGEWTMESAEVAALDGDMIYINLHTEQFPDGEIRGQVDVVDGQ